MEKPTLEEVKEYFKDAEQVIGIQGTEFKEINRIHSFGSDVYCYDENNFSREIWNPCQGYAKILTYKTQIMRKAIVMRCNQKQFDAIRPKLEKIGKIGRLIGSFIEYHYLTNDYNSEVNLFDFTCKDWVSSKEIHETWNEEIFLKACGIEVNYKIIKETILKYDMREEFPEVFISVIEKGKWYKGNKCLFFITDIELRQRAYGFDIFGNWNNESDGWNFKNLSEATPQEVEESLKNEAVKRGFKEGNYFIEPTNCFDYSDKKRFLKGEIIMYNRNVNSLCFSGTESLIYKDGIWATIIETITKSEAEKLLNKKII